MSKLRTASLLAALSLIIGLQSCGGTIRVRYDKSQRWPEPMKAMNDPLPPGDESLYAPGPEEIIVIRHADPVHVRPAGSAGSFPLTFYDKERRLNAGSWIYTNQGGRVELIWSSGSSISLNNQSTAVIGSPSRGEPLLMLWEVDYAKIEIGPDDVVQLLGGAMLRSNGGTVVVEHPKREIERVRNQTKGEIRIDYRDEIFVLDPGQVIDLPLLSVGSEPLAVIPGARSIAGDGFQVDVLGRVSVIDDERGVRLHADGEHQIRGLGVRVRLLEGEEVIFEALGAEGRDWRPPVKRLPNGATYMGQEPPIENR